MKHEKSSQNIKQDSGKPKLSLVPPAIIKAVGNIRTFGNTKYSDPNSWKQVEPVRYRDALMRHLVEYLEDPSSLDKESRMPHLWHMACNIAFLCHLERDLYEHSSF